jgi:hypothetical protein
MDSLSGAVRGHYQVGAGSQDWNHRKDLDVVQTVVDGLDMARAYYLRTRCGPASHTDYGLRRQRGSRPTASGAVNLDAGPPLLTTTTYDKRPPQDLPGTSSWWWIDDGSEGTMRAHRYGRTRDTMRSVEMRKRRSETLPKICRRADDALPYSTLD